MKDSKRVRDPLRGERITQAAVELFSQKGFQAVNLTDIGAEAGIVGSGIYRHFKNKMSILIEILDRAAEHLNIDAKNIIQSETQALSALVLVLSAQIRRTFADRQLYHVYLQEAMHLPKDDFRRLQQKQRDYVGVWTQLLQEVRPELSYEQVRTTVHSTISGTHSVLRYRSGLPADQLHDELLNIGCRTLGIDGLLQSMDATPLSVLKQRGSVLPFNGVSRK